MRSALNLLACAVMFLAGVYCAAVLLLNLGVYR